MREGKLQDSLFFLKKNLICIRASDVLQLQFFRSHLMEGLERSLGESQIPSSPWFNSNVRDPGRFGKAFITLPFSEDQQKGWGKKKRLLKRQRKYFGAWRMMCVGVLIMARDFFLRFFLLFRLIKIPRLI